MNQYFSWRASVNFFSGLVIVLISIGLGYAGNVYTLTRDNLLSVQKNLNEISASREQLFLENKGLASELEQLTGEKRVLSETLTEEKNKNDTFESQIRAISGTVGDLDKLSKTDKELLQKYSKIYFLNENYVPENLTVIDAAYVLDKTKRLSFHGKAYPFLQKMMEAAAATNTPLAVVSAFRSFSEQAALKTSYKMTYGSGANQFSADQGYSEHQLGTAIDFAAPQQNGLSLTFDATLQGKWLAENAYKYGFVLSYPKGNSYYQYEPWHYRFIGTTLARQVHLTNIPFYDMPQRDINSYLLSIFEP